MSSAVIGILTPVWLAMFPRYFRKNEGRWAGKNLKVIQKLGSISLSAYKFGLNIMLITLKNAQFTLAL